MPNEAEDMSRRYEAGKDRCPVCGSWHKKQKNGRMRAHHRELMVGTFYKTERCPGTGQVITK